ncbi:MAG TPA: AI-2E family transporter [Ohtaekwangia sp.]|nr:AI-2E family transporter [Ohtaekwangia sp.]
MLNEKLIKTATILIILVLAVVILKFGKPFLVPIAFAGLLAMLLLPVSVWFQKKGFHKAIGILFSILMLLSFFAVVIAFISWQASDMVENATKIEQQVSDKYREAQQYISKTLGISPEKQKEMMKQQQSSSPGKLSGVVTGIIGGIGGLLTNGLLILVYIFLFMYFRGHLKRFILRLTPEGKKDKAIEVIHQSQKVTQKYLTGLSLMIIGLWIMYGIGFSIIGVKNAIFFAILCGVLEIVPFVGNLIGNGLTIIMSLIQGGGSTMVIGILITYAVVQFIQSYILEPLVVGSEVNINPLFTILGLIGGELIWGIPGMVLAIPLMGVTKIVFDHVDQLKPYGELMGEDKKGDKGFKKKIKEISAKVFRR